MGAVPNDPRRCLPIGSLAGEAYPHLDPPATLVTRISQPDSFYERRSELAKEAHQRHSEIQDQVHTRMSDFAASAIRAPAVVATSAIGAILLALAQFDSLPVTLAPYFWPLLCLGGGVFGATLAPGAVYLSYACLAAALDRERLSVLPPFVLETRLSRLFRLGGAAFRVTTILLVLAAISSTVAGALWAWRVAM